MTGGGSGMTDKDRRKMKRQRMTPFPGAFGRGCASGLPFHHSCESRNPASFSLRTKKKAKTLDPRLEMSRMTRRAKAPDEGHARAPMVLGPFAEPKAPVLSNAKELTINNRLPTKSRFLVSLGMTTERHPPDEGHARAPMVLGPFAKPKEPVLSVAKRSRRNLVARGRNPA